METWTRFRTDLPDLASHVPSHFRVSPSSMLAYSPRVPSPDDEELDALWGPESRLHEETVAWRVSSPRMVVSRSMSPVREHDIDLDGSQFESMESVQNANGSKPWDRLLNRPFIVQAPSLMNSPHQSVGERMNRRDHFRRDLHGVRNDKDDEWNDEDESLMSPSRHHHSRQRSLDVTSRSIERAFSMRVGRIEPNTTPTSLSRSKEESKQQQQHEKVRWLSPGFVPSLPMHSLSKDSSTSSMRRNSIPEISPRRSVKEFSTNTVDALAKLWSRFQHVSNQPSGNSLSAPMESNVLREWPSDFDDENTLTTLTPLAEACRLEDLNKIKSLLASGEYDGDELFDGQQTCLIKAVLCGQLSVVETLLEGGVNANFVLPYGTSLPPTALIASLFSTSERSLEISKCLLRHGADPNLFPLWSERKSVLSPYRIDGYSPLCYAVINSNPNGVSLLCDHGANVNWQEESGEQIFPLLLASELDDDLVTGSLLSHGADSSKVDASGATAMDIGFASGCDNAIAEMIRHGVPLPPSVIEIPERIQKILHSPRHPSFLSSATRIESNVVEVEGRQSVSPVQYSPIDSADENRRPELERSESASPTSTYLENTGFVTDEYHGSYRCTACGRPMVELKRCSGCKQVYYCSQVCQMMDWPRHRFDCRKRDRQTNEIKLPSGHDS